jgi:hypothetical protein
VVFVGSPRGGYLFLFTGPWVFLGSPGFSFFRVFSFSPWGVPLAAALGILVSVGGEGFRGWPLLFLSNGKRRQFFHQFENTVRPVLIEKSNNILTPGFTDNFIKVPIGENISIQNTIVSVLLKKNHGSYMEGEII